MRGPITFMLACACPIDTPSFRRANEVSQWKSLVMFEGWNASGRQTWAAARSKALPSGRTPMIVWACPLNCTTRFTTPGSDTN